jgi:2-polyprenyl-3-methyl-5-hydroxy-6-metoxy-1,4-benzoquinol methylase
MTIVDNELAGFFPTQKWFIERIISSTSGLTLDCGCGRGFWSKELKEKGREVIGVEISTGRLKYAKVEGNSDQVICASSTHLPFKQNCFDSAIFIEVIEHLSEQDQIKALGEIHRSLKIHGTFVITTPNRLIYHLLSKYLHLFRYNPEHVKELSFKEFRNLVTKYFNIISIDGKISSKRFLGSLDNVFPSFLCWQILIIGKKLKKIDP